MAHRIIIDRVQNGWIVTDEFNPSGELTTARYIAKDYADVGEIVGGLTMVAGAALNIAEGVYAEAARRAAAGCKPGDVGTSLEGLSKPHLVEDPA